ncbi:MAG: Gldg family protein, partial [Phycisphaerae bacterium]
MAVDSTANGSAPDGASSHRFLVGTNVMVATAIVVAIVVVAQLIAFRSTTRWDLTSSGINSLSEGSENLLRGLDGNVRLTSLYFEANPEDEDQPRYRRAVRDLLDLYESTNRAKVRSDWVNPLQDHEAYRALTRRLADKAAFKEQIEGYQERITKYQEEIDTKIRALVQSELDQIAAMGSALGGAPRDPAIAQVQNAFQKLIAAVESQREQIDAHMLGDSPLYTQTTAALRTFYTQLSRDLKNISDFAKRAIVTPSWWPCSRRKRPPYRTSNRCASTIWSPSSAPPPTRFWSKPTKTPAWWISAPSGRLFDRARADDSMIARSRARR